MHLVGLDIGGSKTHALSRVPRSGRPRAVRRQCQSRLGRPDRVRPPARRDLRRAGRVRPGTGRCGLRRRRRSRHSSGSGRDARPAERAGAGRNDHGRPRCPPRPGRRGSGRGDRPDRRHRVRGLGPRPDRPVGPRRRLGLPAGRRGEWVRRGPGDGPARAPARRPGAGRPTGWPASSPAPAASTDTAELRDHFYARPERRYWAGLAPIVCRSRHRRRCRGPADRRHRRRGAGRSGPRRASARSAYPCPARWCSPAGCSGTNRSCAGPSRPRWRRSGLTELRTLEVDPVQRRARAGPRRRSQSLGAERR